METIKSIEEVYSYEVPHKVMDYDGFIITTTKRSLALLISNGQSCCETWGYMCSADEVEDFVGANLLGLVGVDKDYKKTEELLKRESDKLKLYMIELEDTCILNLETDRGLLQFAVYNLHNGYYGHSVIIRDGLREATVYL